MSSLMPHCQEFLDAILAGQRIRALEIVHEARRVCASPTDIYVEVFQEALYEVGRLWETNRITVAGEHVATAVAQYVLAQMYFETETPPPVRGNAVVTGVEGEFHNVGAHIVADALEHDGWNVRLLGSDLPVSGILDIVAKHEAAVLGVSTTMRTNVPATARLVSEVRRQFGSAVRVVVGGGAFRWAPHLAAQIGADGFASDVRSALEMLRHSHSGSAQAR
jgi:methanogenic corrinoid protein MtbC1